MKRRSLLPIFAAPAFAQRSTLTAAPFSADITPPPGSPLCFSLVEPAKEVSAPLKAKGIALFPAGQAPIILCALDWLGIGGASYTDWKTALAQALRTSPDRVALHTVHQHDAPGSYQDAHALLAQRGLGDLLAPEDFAREALGRVVRAVQSAKRQEISALGFGSATVEGIASNRRIVGEDGTFLFQRFTTCRNSEYCAAPDGVIDPLLRTLSFYAGSYRLATLHYYATHPMSTYGKGSVNADFVGEARESLPGFHVYFTGAAGNIGPGKYNDGQAQRRGELRQRLRAAMEKSIASENKTKNVKLHWANREVLLPHRSGRDFTEAAILRILDDASALPRDRASAARYLAWYQACQRRETISLSRLATEAGQVLHLPGELFVEYQLAAQQESPLPLAAAAYGDYGPMYIGTAKSYREGGYETSVVSRVGPEVEDILLSNTRALLKI
jgi:hypothetical protein